MNRTSAFTVVALAIAAVPLCAQDWTKESKDRAKRAALHDTAQLVRGDSGKWSDDARLQHAPPLAQKPAKMALDAWADLLLKKQLELTDKDDNWLIFRTEQLDDNDRLWIERHGTDIGRHSTVDLAAHLGKSATVRTPEAFAPESEEATGNTSAPRPAPASGN